MENQEPSVIDLKIQVLSLQLDVLNLKASLLEYQKRDISQYCEQLKAEKSASDPKEAATNEEQNSRADLA